jgi:hypothetical protein
VCSHKGEKKKIYETDNDIEREEKGGERRKEEKKKRERYILLMYTHPSFKKRR